MMADWLPTTSRRRFLAAVPAAALASPLAAVPALAAPLPSPDPIYAAIRRHREAFEAHGVACALASVVEQEAIDAGIRWDDHPGMAGAEERQRAACRADRAALWGVATTAPTAEFPKRECDRLMAVSSPELKAFLVDTPFFGGLSDASLDLLISMLVERHFEAGATVIAEEEPGRSMYIVRSGELVVSKLGASGCVIDMNRLGPGDFFGEMTLIEAQNRSATLVAESPIILYELTARNLHTYYKADIYAYAMVMQNINRELCRRLRRADNRIAELANAARGPITPIRVRPEG